MAKKEKNTGMAVVGIILPIIPLLTEDKKDPYVKYYTKQGLVLWIFDILLWVVMNFIVRLIFVSIFSFAIVSFLNMLIALVIIALFIIGIINALSGKEKPLPLIGDFAKKINI